MSFIINKTTQVVIDNEVVFTDIQPFDVHNKEALMIIALTNEADRLRESGFGFTRIEQTSRKAVLIKTYDHGHVITKLEINNTGSFGYIAGGEYE